VAAIGAPVALALGADVEGLAAFPALAGPGCVVPSTQEALWMRISGPDRGIVFDAARNMRMALAEAFAVSDVLDTFTYHGGRDLARFESFPESHRDHVIGRAAADNEELDDAPASAHVKRTAQESFDPPAFMIRRSMPWAGADTEGLEFVAFVASLDRFERMMRRMLGLEDGMVDGLFEFSRPVTGGYYWCPPAERERLDLSVLLDARR